jgi:hypothetical protein
MHAKKYIEVNSPMVMLVQIVDSIIFGAMCTVITLIVYSTVFISMLFVRIALLFGMYRTASSDSNKGKSG